MRDKPTTKKPWPLALAGLVLLSGCASTGPVVSQAAVDRENKMCENQVNADRAAREPRWFTRWLTCKRDRVMPFEIAQHRRKEQDIRAMYEDLISMGAAVDRGTRPVQSVYKEWDRRQVELGIRQCLLRLEQKDGSSDCVR